MFGNKEDILKKAAKVGLKAEFIDFKKETKISNRVGIIIGSTRPNRIGEQIAGWVFSNIAETEGLEFNLIDLAAWNLPMINVPGIPAHDKYIYEHTKKWSNEISSYQAFLFITPQYNWGYPASLKNSLDFFWTGLVFSHTMC